MSLAPDEYAYEKSAELLAEIGLEPRCPKHPAYKAIHKPRCRCRPCWKLWKGRNR